MRSRGSASATVREFLPILLTVAQDSQLGGPS